MRFRSNPIPTRWWEIFAFLIPGVFLPVLVLYEILVVLPKIHEPGSVPYAFTLLMSIFITANIEGNLWASMLVDTSVDHKRVEIPSEGDVKRLEWRLCASCNKLAPPKSWHCKLCDVCILGRDHHCGFTGCCIGHQNLRYFVCFLIYLFVGSVYAVVYNAIYVFKFHSTEFMGMFNMILLWTNLNAIPGYFPVSALLISLCSLFFGTSVLVGQSSAVLNGAVKNEHAKYNRGIYLNLQTVFGRRMHVAWIFPLIKSPLPGDGYSWKTSEDNATTDDSKPNMEEILLENDFEL